MKDFCVCIPALQTYFALCKLVSLIHTFSSSRLEFGDKTRTKTEVSAEMRYSFQRLKTNRKRKNFNFTNRDAS